VHVEGGVLREIYVERLQRRGIVGNIYKGRVSRLLPGIQAAFVDIGMSRAGFLHAADLGVGRTNNDNGTGKDPPISQMLHQGQNVLVKVVKDPIGTKGARLTGQISVPSRYLVLLPGGEGVGVSARIASPDERDRLRQAVEQVMPEDGDDGYIVRTAAENSANGALESDIQYLAKLWTSIQKQAGSKTPGHLVYEDLSLPLRALRDLASPSTSKVRIDDQEVYEKALEFAARFIPELEGRIERYSDQPALFELYGVEDEIQRALERKVPLKSGGYLVIDQTEAMTTIDVNTGGFVGRSNLEETIYKTNLEAAQTIARQLRLRNLGGIIIIDFIDMLDDAHKAQVMRTLDKALEKDHAKINLGPLSDFGLVEMTRKRTRESLEHILCEPCSICDGRGFLKTTETVCYEIFHEVNRAVRQFDAERLLILAAPQVVQHILEEESAGIAELEEHIGKTIELRSEDQYGQDQFDVVLF